MACADRVAVENGRWPGARAVDIANFDKARNNASARFRRNPEDLHRDRAGYAEFP
jgi:hypothetical protein